MRKLLLLALWLTCVLGISSCASTGKGASPAQVCPEPPPIPASLMQAPNYEQRLRGELFTPAPSATPRSGDSNGS